MREQVRGKLTFVAILQVMSSQFTTARLCLKHIEYTGCAAMNSVVYKLFLVCLDLLCVLGDTELTAHAGTVSALDHSPPGVLPCAD